MAGRPKLYNNAAEKTRAYREREAQRTVKMDRVTLDQLEEHLDELRLCVNQAAQRGDPLAQSLRTTMMTDLLADLALYFRSGCIAPCAAALTARKRSKGGDQTTGN
jgi:hypothetical protein